jgi:phosphatidylglycerophosphatase A
VSRASSGWRRVCLTVLGTGYLPIASGTWSSAATSVLFAGFWMLVRTAGGPRALIELVAVLAIGVASWLSVRWGAWAIALWGRSDPKQFTLDEFAGQLVSCLWLPVALTADVRLFACVLAGQFFLFRVMDVWKPPPARQAESLPAGWGILTDDLFAGIYANLAGQLLWRVIPLAAWLGVPATP